MNRRGMTLLELMIAMILTGLVAFIAYELLLGEKTNYTVTKRKISLQADAREAMRILEEEMKNTGYNYSTNYSARTHMQDPSCSQTLYSTTKAAINPAPSSSIYGTGATGLEIHFYNPMMTSSISCTDDLWTIGYKYDPVTKKLSRQAVKGSSKSLNADDFVPFLDSVQQFDISYGTFLENDTLQIKKDIKDYSWTIPSGMSSPTFTDDTIVSFTYPSTPGTYDVILQKQLGEFDPQAMYRVSFWVNSSDSLIDSIKGIGKTSTAGNGYVVGGFFSNGTTLTDSLTFRPLKVGAMRQVQYDLVHKKTSGTSNLSFGLRVKLLGSVTASNTSATRTLSIYGLTVVRLNSGRYLKWINATQAADPLNAVKIRAIRIRMLANDKKHTSRGSGTTSDQISLDRIIPMVNNGN